MKTRFQCRKQEVEKMYCLKKLMCLAVFTVMLVSLSLSVAEDCVIYDAEQRAIQVSYTGCNPSGQYMVFFLRDGANISGFSAADIYFMDQITADTSGLLSLLYVGPEFSSCQVAISGTFPGSGTSPKIIGRFRPSGEFSMLTMPTSLIQIEDEAFEGGTFTHVYLGASVESIGNKAFANCQNLVYIEIPTETITIADNAFLNSPHVVIGCTAGSNAYDYAVRKGLQYRIREQ